MSMLWHDLLFAHWPVSVEALREHVPEGLEIETFDGSAWIGVVPFRMTEIGTRWTRPLPGLRAFAETNLRTYVRHGGKSGVYFLSLDAPHWLAVMTARWVFHLPYHLAAVESKCCGEAVEHRSVRRKGPRAELVARYWPTGNVTPAREGTLDYFLAERYRLFTTDRRGKLWTARIRHAPWPLQPAEAEIESNTLVAAMGIGEPEVEPVLRFSKLVHAVVWMPERA